MIRIQSGARGGAEAGGRTPRRTDRHAAPDYLAFSRNAVRAGQIERDIELRQRGIETSPVAGGRGLPKLSPKGLRAVGYLRVSTADQADSGNGLAAQRRSIAAEADKRGWALEWAEDAGKSGKSLDGRVALQATLARLAAGEVDVLIVAKLDRLIRSVADFAAIVDAAKRQGWALVALDLNVDTSTPQGEFMANVMASMAQFERRLIGQRTKDALAIVKANGPKPGKLAIGRPWKVDNLVRIDIHKRYALGDSMGSIARAFNLPRSTVQGILGPASKRVRLNS